MTGEPSFDTDSKMLTTFEPRKIVGVNLTEYPTGHLGDWTRPMGKGSRQVEYRCGVAGNSGNDFAEGECKLKTSHLLLDH